MQLDFHIKLFNYFIFFLFATYNNLSEIYDKKMHDLFHITPAITPRPMSALDCVWSDTLDGLPLRNICGYVPFVVMTIPSSYMPHHWIFNKTLDGCH